MKRLVLAAATMLWIGGAAAGDAAEANAPEKKMYAHYMGCYPLHLWGKPWPEKIDYRSGKYLDALGGLYYNPPLLPENYSADGVEAAALDIRRAIRAGIDGFAVDVLAGRERAAETVRNLFRAAEKYDLPFEITFCLDIPFRNPAAVKLTVDEFRNSPKLARRNGKILFLGYITRDAEGYVKEYFQRLKEGRRIVPANFEREAFFAGFPKLSRDTIDFPELNSPEELWSTPEGFAAHIKPFRHYEKKFGNGEKMMFEFELSSLLRGFSAGPRKQMSPEYLKRAVAALAKDFDILGSFLPSTIADDEQIVELAAIARENGAEWSEAVCYQYDNPNWSRILGGPLVETMLRRWEMVEKTKATILQFTTWNDYTENTLLAPGYETRYVHSELNAYFAEKWKTGREPAVETDKIYAVYHKYPVGAEAASFPFRSARILECKKVLEVVTILTAPGRVTLPGRDISYDAPAGFCYRQFPASPGRVEVTVSRNGEVVKSLKCGEPITGKVFRQQATPTAYSSEFMTLWREDFGDAEPVSLRGFYEVEPGSRFPNWFRQLFFGTYGDFRNMPAVDPDGDPDQDGATNYEEFLRGTDPVRKDSDRYEPGFCWNLLKDLPDRYSFNPDLDSRAGRVWHYYGLGKDGMTPLLFTDLDRTPQKGGMTITHRFPMYDRGAWPWGRYQRDPAFPGCRISHVWKQNEHRLFLEPKGIHGTSLGFRAPCAGTFSVDLAAAAPGKGKLKILSGRKVLAELNLESRIPVRAGLEADLKADDILFFTAEPGGENGRIEISDIRIVLNKNSGRNAGTKE